MGALRDAVEGSSTGDLAANATFAAFRVTGMDCAGFQIVHPAAWNGLWPIEISEDSTNGVDGNWSETPPDAAAPASAAGAGAFTLKISKLTWNGWMRLRFVRTSGTGIATVYHRAKGT